MCICGLLLGLSIGDSPNSQPVGIVLTVVGVVVLDFCADASEGPIVAYLLDVADTEEQDMALNIHGLSAGRTCTFSIYCKFTCIHSQEATKRLSCCMCNFQIPQIT